MFAKLIIILLRLELFLDYIYFVVIGAYVKISLANE